LPRERVFELDGIACAAPWRERKILQVDAYPLE
jgi:hypothetical protein